MSDKEDLERWLENTSEKVQRNVAVVTPEDLDQPYLYHISNDTTIKNFVPMIGHRQHRLEDRTVPRICVSSSILACLIGHNGTSYDFLERRSDGQKGGYLGGWKIYAFPFKAALKPNKRLIPVEHITNEYWLTSYNPATSNYTAESAGKFFYRSITFKGVSGEKPTGSVEIFAEITSETPVRFSVRHKLSQGYWKIEGPLYENLENYREDKEFVIESITREVYLSNKKAVADLLGYKLEIPASNNW